MGCRVDKNGKPEFSTLNFYRHIMNELEKNDLSSAWVEDIDTYNEIIRIMTVVPGTVELFNMIENNTIINYEFNVEEKNILKVLYNYFKKNGKLSYHSLSESVLEKACDDMIENEMNFMQIRRLKKYDEEAKKHFIKIYQNQEKKHYQINPVFVDDLIASPQVKKSLRQAIKVINAIIVKEKCLPQIIAIESTKEMNGKDRISEINKEQKIQETLRKAANTFLSKNYGDNFANETNIERVMLYNETNGHCAYCGTTIDINELIKGSIETEHILPRAESFNNSYNNKTISCRKCNSDKNKKTPFYYLNPLGKYDDFKKKVIENKNFSEEKKKNLTFEEDISKYTTRFFNRNLRDTSYATTELIKQINIFNNYLETIDKNNRILTLSTPGQLTSQIRKRSNLKKDRDDGKFHHAVDASIIASISTTGIGKIMLTSQNDKTFWLNHKKGIIDKEDLVYKVNIASTIEIGRAHV